MFRRKTQTIMGHTLPSPRVTRTGFRLMLLQVAAPLLIILLLMDVALYLFFRFVLDSCYGVLCLF